MTDRRRDLHLEVLELGAPVYRLIGDTHTLDGLTGAAQEFLRALDSIRKTLAADAGVSGTELRALSRVAEGRSVTPKAPAEFLEMSTPAVTSVTTALVGRGLLTRSEHPSDRRSLLLELTPEGHRSMEATYTAFQAAITGAAAGLDATQVAGLEEGLSAMAESLAEAPQTSGSGYIVGPA